MGLTEEEPSFREAALKLQGVTISQSLAALGVSALTAGLFLSGCAAPPFPGEIASTSETSGVGQRQADPAIPMPEGPPTSSSALGRRELDAYLTVIESVGHNLPDTITPCFRSTFWHGGDTPVDPELLQALQERGWAIFHPASPADLGNLVVHVREVAPDETSLLIFAGFSAMNIGEKYVTWWSPFWSFRVDCQVASCRILEPIGEGHGDGPTMPTEEFRATKTGTCAPTAQERLQILNQTVDSLPHLIGRIWGYEDYKPYTFVLNEKLLARQEIGGPELPVGAHDGAFIEHQHAKPFVLGTCSGDRLLSDACSPGRATMAVGLNNPVIEGDTATVQVRIFRPPNPEGPKRGSVFFAEFRVEMIRSSDGWLYRGYKVTEIT